MWLFIAPGLYRNEKRYILPFLISTVGLFIAGGVVRLQNGLPRVPGFLNRLRPTVPTDDYDWGVYEIVPNDHHRSRPDFRNADSRVFSRFDAGDYGSLDVAEPAIFRTGDFCCRSNRHTQRRHREYVSSCRSNGRALRHQYRSGLAGQFGSASAQSRRRLACASESPL
jgi:Sec-independent protein translocase protein (TatC)